MRFAFWGAEELGLIGSRQYVAGLGRAERRSIVAYLNLDMVGSPNPVPFVYDGDPAGGASARVERVLRAEVGERGLRVEQDRLGGASDHAPFAAADIPVGGLFTGASEVKTRRQAELHGGRCGRPYDPCYHRRCDTLRNVDRELVGTLAGATADAIDELARR